MKMYIGNLSIHSTEEDLKEIFSEYGAVDSVNIVLDRFTKQSRGFGFVEMSNNSEADKAIKALNGSELKGKNIKISQAEPNRRKKSYRRR